MEHYRYLIIGGGMTADAATRGIRDVDPDGTIGIIAAEPDPPYNRPPLSKGLWKGKPVEKIWRGTAARAAGLHLGHTAVSLDPAARCVVDDQGIQYGYDRLLLATGGTPRRLPFGGDDIIYFRTFQDYARLRSLAESKKRFAVIGTGFIGSEVAAALKSAGREVIMVSPEGYIGERIYPRDLAVYVTQYYHDQGVEVRARTLVKGLQKDGEAFRLEVSDQATGDAEVIRVDQVVAGLGIAPNTELAKAAGAEVADGIVVDAGLHTTLPGIYAAGDVASFYNRALDRRLRVEHEDNANTMGRLAGQSMAGKAIVYDHLPFFYSDLFDLGYEAVGELDSRLETFADWQEPYRTGVVYYLKEGRVRGVLLWNVWSRIDAARKLIADGNAYRHEELRGKITG
jgi:3-phenylpropionate/trans-cinnamate dioxygenase ferredoxin reductase component